MNKTLFMNFSPNKNGNTNFIGEKLLKNIDYETLQMVDYKISQYGQVFEDDQISEVFEKIKDADTLVIGAPVYWYTVGGLLKTFIDRWHKIHDLWYFYKSDDYDFHFINELLGEVISEYFGLDTVHYHVASLCVKDELIRYGLVSKNFCTPNYQYKRSWDYGFSPRKDLDILKEVQSICHSEKEYLLLVEDLKKFFIRDFYTSQLDRSGNNFLFQQTPSGIRLAPLYDYENSFETSYVDVYRNQIAEINLQNPETLMILKKDSKFQELLHLLMQSDMSSFLNEVEERHQIRIPSEYKTDYRSHTSEVKKLIVEKKLL